MNLQALHHPLIGFRAAPPNCIAHTNRLFLGTIFLRCTLNAVSSPRHILFSRRPTAHLVDFCLPLAEEEFSDELRERLRGRSPILWLEQSGPSTNGSGQTTYMDCIRMNTSI